MIQLPCRRHLAVQRLDAHSRIKWSTLDWVADCATDQKAWTFIAILAFTEDTFHCLELLVPPIFPCIHSLPTLIYRIFREFRLTMLVAVPPGSVQLLFRRVFYHGLQISHKALPPADAFLRPQNVFKCFTLNFLTLIHVGKHGCPARASFYPRDSYSRLQF